MKTKKYYFVLAAVTAIFCVLAFGGPKLPPPVRQRVIGEPPFEPGLIGQPHPALVGIDELYVVINPPDSEPNKDGLVFEKLREKIKKQLKIAGLKIASDDVPEKFETILRKRLEKNAIKQDSLKFRSINIPELRVDTDMLKLEESQHYVFHIQTSLAAKVFLGEAPSHSLKAAVWKARPTMQAVSVQNMPAKVTDVVLEQIEAFVLAYIVANMEAAQTPDANDVATAIQQPPVKLPPTITVAKYKFVASKNSKVFHKPDCTWAKRIKPENLVGYNSRQEAIRAGKRPCKLCKP